MAEGCLNKTTKYFLFASNFLIFILGTALLVAGIWILADKPENFFQILDQAGAGICEDDPACNEFSSDVYKLGAWALIGLAAVMVIIAFFGCCGAIKENKCMLGTYFSIIVVLFILMLVGAVMGYFFEFEKRIKIPLDHALMKYNDSSSVPDERSVDRDAINVIADNHPEVYKKTWNKVQEELYCCGVSGAADWNKTVNFDWEKPTYNKPEGCCHYKREIDQAVQLSAAEIEVCRSKSTEYNDPNYYFEGCYDIIREEIQKYQEVVIGLAVGIVGIMFLNMLFSFSLCMMVKSTTESYEMN